MATLLEEDSSVDDILDVFSNKSLQDACKDNPDVTLYLSQLSSYGVQRLAQEPERLAEEKSTILEQTQDLAFKNYKTFIQTAECSHEAFQEFGLVEKRLSSMQEKLPGFVAKCQDFTQRSQLINVRWRQASQTLSKHNQLMEVLEMSQLMDTCVRNGYYEEALELSSYIQRLEKKQSSIPLIASIGKEVWDSVQLMLNQLLQQLHSSIQLPNCLKVIGYLRRLDMFSEAELRVKFLQARDSWFQGLLKAIPKSDAYEHITKTVEVSRVHLFDIITQYRAIFSDEDPIRMSVGNDSSPNDAAIFHSWLTFKVSEFLETLQYDLSHIAGHQLEAVLAPCMYFGLSLSRVGADFRPVLVAIFEHALLTRFCQVASDSAQRFEETMQSFTLTSLATASVTSSLSSSFLSELHDSMKPPEGLIDFFPLAQYYNDIVTGFNELRLCAPHALVTDIKSALQVSLCRVARAIVEFHKAEANTFNQKENMLFTQMCIQFATELVPTLDRFLKCLYPANQLSKTLGITLTDFGKLENFSQVDTAVVLQIVQDLLPPKDDDDEGITLTLGPSKHQTSIETAVHEEQSEGQVVPVST